MTTSPINSNFNTYSNKIHAIIDNIIFYQYPSFLSSFLKHHLDMWTRGYHDFGSLQNYIIQNHLTLLLYKQNLNQFSYLSYEEFYQNSDKKKYIIENVNYASIAKTLNLKYETFRRYRLEMEKAGWFKFGSHTIEFTQQLLEKKKIRQKLWIKSQSIFLKDILKLINKHVKINLCILDTKWIEERIGEYFESSIVDSITFQEAYVANWIKLFGNYESYLVFDVALLNQIRTIEYENDKQNLGLNFITTWNYFYNIPPRFAMNSASIADSLGFSRSTVNRHLIHLEKKKFIIQLANLNNKDRTTLANSYPFKYNQSSSEKLDDNISKIDIKILGGKKSYLIHTNIDSIRIREKIRKLNYRLKIDYMTQQLIRLKLISEDSLAQITASGANILSNTSSYIKSETPPRK